MFFRLACKSLLNRKGSVVLTILAISVSIFVLLGIEHIRQQAKDSFGNTISGTDLIVGARTSNINLLLYSIFRIGNATNNIGWETYQRIDNSPSVAWTIPISLGDSHRGYRVMGTNSDYFHHYSYGKRRPLEFNEGRSFEELFDVVPGSAVATRLNYKIGDKLILSHGLVGTSFNSHDQHPFTVVGILKPTGTPVDQTLHVSLEGLEAIHMDSTLFADHDNLEQQDLTPDSITAFMIGMTSKMLTFRLQRQINEYPKEPLLAILPGVALSELWQSLTTTENILRLISVLVLVAALLGLSALLLASVRERQREIAIIRSLGASPWFLFMLIEAEALLITLVASLIAILTLFSSLIFTRDWIVTEFGLHIESGFLTEANLLMLVFILLGTMVICLIPAVSAYLRALQKELSD